LLDRHHLTADRALLLSFLQPHFDARDVYE
jgi:hypothetical protein